MTSIDTLDYICPVTDKQVFTDIPEEGTAPDFRGIEECPACNGSHSCQRSGDTLIVEQEGTPDA